MSRRADVPEPVPCPAVAPFLGEGAAAALAAPGDLRLRRFGARLEDLQVDLADTGPQAVTDIIECCTVPPLPRGASLELPVGTRIECLLVLAALDGAEEVDADLRCAFCGQMLEVTLTIVELLEAGRTAGTPEVEVEVRGRMRRFRRPTGRDQVVWMGDAYTDEGAVRRVMVASLAVPDPDEDAREARRSDALREPEDDLAEAEVAGIEATLDQADPLLRGAVTSACPDCGRSAEHEVDLTGFALRRLQRSQDALLETVHLLASRYHWTEADVLKIPEWRRARYVARLQRADPP